MLLALIENIHYGLHILTSSLLCQLPSSYSNHPHFECYHHHQYWFSNHHVKCGHPWLHLPFEAQSGTFRDTGFSLQLCLTSLLRPMIYQLTCPMRVVTNTEKGVLEGHATQSRPDCGFWRCLYTVPSRQCLCGRGRKPTEAAAPKQLQESAQVSIYV